MQKRLGCVLHRFVHISLVEIVRRQICFKIIAIWKHSERKGTFYHLRSLYYWSIFSILLKNRVFKQTIHLSLQDISLPCFTIIFPIINPYCIILDQNTRRETFGFGCHQNVQFISKLAVIQWFSQTILSSQTIHYSFRFLSLPNPTPSNLLHIPPFIPLIFFLSTIKWQNSSIVIPT